MRRSRLTLSALYSLVQIYLLAAVTGTPKNLLRCLDSDPLVVSGPVEDFLPGNLGDSPTGRISHTGPWNLSLPGEAFKTLLMRVGQVLRQMDPESWEVLLVDGTDMPLHGAVGGHCVRCKRM